jgi:peptidyl-prolyl cis-trans isomerase B (cyclophilin B)
MMRRQRVFVPITLLTCAVLFAGCGKQADEPPPVRIEADELPTNSAPNETDGDPIELTAAEARGSSPALPVLVEDPEVLIHTNQGTIRIRLFAKDAPQTVANFLRNYVDRAEYHDSLVHYVEQDYMMIAGGYNAKYEEIPERAAVAYEGDNGLSNRRGTVGLLRQVDYVDSGTSQFFFNLGDNAFLDHQATDGDADDEDVPGYCVFGEIVEGLDVMDKMGSVTVEDRDGFEKTPSAPLVVTSVERVY